MAALKPHKVVDRLHRKYCKKYDVNAYDVRVGLMAWEPVIYVLVRTHKGNILVNEMYDYHGKLIN